MSKKSGKNDEKRSSGFKDIFRSLKYRNFRLFFMGQSISLIGTWIQRIALPWLVYHMTNSVVLLGVVGFASQIPAFLLASFAGVMSDRWNRYRIMITTQSLSMLQAMILTILFFSGTIAVWHIIVLSIFLGCVNAFDVPARQSFFVEMVGKTDLGNAIALNSSMVNSARLLGPSIAGILIATTGEGTCFLVNGLSYLMVIGCLLSMKISLKRKPKKNVQVMKELKEGFTYVFSFAPIKSVILLLALVSLMGMPYNVLMPVFAKAILHGDSHTFGFLMGASGLGALSGAIYLASRKDVIGLSRLIPLAAGIFGTGLISLSFSRVFSLSLFFMVIVGLGMMLQIASSNTLIQTVTDDDKRGRVMSFYAMAFMGILPFGSLMEGWLAKAIGTPWTLFIGGCACILGGLYFASKLPVMNKEVQPIFIKLGMINDIPSDTSSTDI